MIMRKAVILHEHIHRARRDVNGKSGNDCVGKIRMTAALVADTNKLCVSYCR